MERMQSRCKWGGASLVTVWHDRACEHIHVFFFMAHGKPCCVAPAFRDVEYTALSDFVPASFSSWEVATAPSIHLLCRITNSSQPREFPVIASFPEPFRRGFICRATVVPQGSHMTRWVDLFWEVPVYCYSGDCSVGASAQLTAQCDALAAYCFSGPQVTFSNSVEVTVNRAQREGLLYSISIFYSEGRNAFNNGFVSGWACELGGRAEGHFHARHDQSLYLADGHPPSSHFRAI